MPVLRAAFLATGRKHHRGSLCTAVRDPDMETSPEAETLAFHRGADRRLCYFLFRELDERLRGTLAPERRASESPIAMACLRLLTFLPERPLFSVPRLRSCMARFTLRCAFFPYFLAIAPSCFGERDYAKQRLVRL
jgi:hypothetical protein